MNKVIRIFLMMVSMCLATTAQATDGLDDVLASVSGVECYTIANGSKTDGMMMFGYAPEKDLNAIVKVGTNELINADASGSFTWFAPTAGVYTVSHTVGENVLSAVYTITNGYAKAEEARPDAPMSLVETISISPTEVSAAATRSFKSITISGSGNWTAATSADWLSLDNTSGTASGAKVLCTIGENTAAEARVGYVYIAGHILTVTQAGRGVTLDKTEIDVDCGGGSETIKVSAANGTTTWNAGTEYSWISILPRTGTGSGSVVVQVAPWNKSEARTGTITIADQVITINQAALGLTYPTSSKKTIAAKGASGTVSITASKGVTWSAVSDADWLVVTDAGQSKRGDGTISWTAQAQSLLSPRTAMITVTPAKESGFESWVYTITQEGAAFTCPSETSKTVAAIGTTGSFAITTEAGVAWSATSDADWLVVMDAGKARYGSGTVKWTAQAQTTLSSRTAKITVKTASASGSATWTYTVTQNGATFTCPTTTAKSVGSKGASGTIAITTLNGISWTATSDASWLEIPNNGQTRYGSETISWTAQAQTTLAERTAMITVKTSSSCGYQVWTFTVTQSAATSLLSQTESVVTAQKEVISIDVDVVDGVNWSIMNVPSWITLTGDTARSGAGTVELTVAPNQTFEERTATITIADIEYTVTQPAAQVEIVGDLTRFFMSDGGSMILTVRVDVAETPWTIDISDEAKSSWVFLPDGQENLSGDAEFEVVVDSCTSAADLPRSATITIGKQVLTILQASDDDFKAITYTNLKGTTHSNPSYYVEGFALSFVAPNEKIVGYTFDGWSPAAITADMTGPQTITAQWTPYTYTIKYNANGGKGTMKDTACEYGTPVALAENEFTYKGYKFIGWAKTAKGNVVYSPGQEVTSLVSTQNGSITLYAVWEAIYSPITYTNLKGATHSNPTTYHEGTAVTFEDPTAVVGYTFDGWTPAAITVDMTGAQTVMANWKANSYTIQYNANGGNGTMDATACTYDAEGEVATNVFTRAGHQFLGWAIEKNGAVVYAAGAKVTNLVSTQDGSITLYAVWEKLDFAILDVKVTPIAPWGVALDYTIVGATEIAVANQLELTATIGNETYMAKTLSGATNCVDGTHRVYWNMAADGISVTGDEEASITLSYKSVLPKYCVIDLSGGTDAEEYPVSWVNVEPEGGFNTDEYKTTKVVLKRVDPGTFIRYAECRSESIRGANDTYNVNVETNYVYGKELDPSLTNELNVAHTITLTQPFYFGVFEMTDEQLAQVDYKDYYTHAWEKYYGKRCYDAIRHSTWPSAPAEETFLGVLRAKTGVSFDMPSMAQWHYADLIEGDFQDMHDDRPEWVLDEMMLWTAGGTYYCKCSHRENGGTLFDCGTDPVTLSYPDFRALSDGSLPIGIDYEYCNMGDFTARLCLTATNLTVNVGETLGSVTVKNVKLKTFADKSEVDGKIELGCAESAAVFVDGVEESVGVWYATSLGEHTFTYVDGDIELEVVYNVTRLAVGKITYTNLKGATHSNPATYQEGTVLTFAAPSEVEWWSFAGWTPAAITADMTGDQTVVANWKIESVPEPVVTPGDGMEFVEEECEVSLACALEGAKIYYTTNGATPKLTEKYLYTTPFTITDSVSIKAIAVYDELKSGYVTAAITKKVLTLAEVLGLESVADVTLETGSDTEWKPILDATSSTGMSAQSAAIEDGEESWLKATVNGKGTFSFKWKVDCEDDPDGATWDHLEVLVDGNESDRIDGATDWAEKTITFTTEGAHTIYWAYVKDEDPSDEEGSDCAWVTDCTWEGEANKDPVPEVGSAADLTAALEGSGDKRLAEHIKDTTKYAKYHAWVDKIAGTGVDHYTARQNVKDSELAWFAYALDLNQLPEKAPESLTIDTIGFAAEGGWDLEVKVGDVEVGSGADAADLGTVFVVEGAADLKEESFSAENVTTTFGTAENGKVKVEVEPKEAKGQFFIRVKMTP